MPDFDVKTCELCGETDFDELGLEIHLANYCPNEKSGSIASRTCKRCGQFDWGQTGEYPCPECGLPTSWDEPEAQSAAQEKIMSITYDEILDRLKEIHAEYCQLDEDNDGDPCGCAIEALQTDVFIAIMQSAQHPAEPDAGDSDTKSDSNSGAG